jgi:hypothetical protein
MKNLTIIKKIVMCAGILIVNVTPVWAATGKEDNSDLFVWIFLAFCALIVVAQLIPAAMVMLGLAKGVKKERIEAVLVKMDQTAQ